MRFACTIVCDVECPEERIEAVLKGLVNVLEEHAPRQGIRLRRGHVAFSAQPGALRPQPVPDDPEELFDGPDGD